MPSARAVANLSHRLISARHPKRRIQGDFSIIEADEEKSVFGNRACPFAEKALGRGATCRMTSNVSGSIAADDLGYAKVVLEETIAEGRPFLVWSSIPMISRWFHDLAQRLPTLLPGKCSHFLNKEITMARERKNGDDSGARGTDSNPDPITGQPGAHPVGAGLGAAAAGAAAGAAGGAMAGPVGAVAGAVIGGVAGGLAGKGVAESIDPTVEDTYWRENYPHRPYYDKAASYEEYRPAYQHGWESRAKYADLSFDEAEPQLRRDWESGKSRSRLTWDKAKVATRDAWDRIDQSAS